LIALRALAGEAAFATWEEAELMEVGMVSERGTADAQALGVDATPTFTVARGDGKAHVLAAGAQDPQTLAAAIDKALAR
jgi:protein-disulfide isomerase